MPNIQLPNVLWNISFPFCLKSFWCFGVAFSKKTSSAAFLALMASPERPGAQQFQLGLAPVNIILHVANKIWL